MGKMILFSILSYYQKFHLCPLFLSNLQRFKSHHPATFIGGGDPTVADHWFLHIEKVLEAMDITSNAAKIRLVAFQLEGES